MPQYGLGTPWLALCGRASHRGWPCRPGRAATDRPWPPWLWPFGGHHPPL